MYGAIQLSGGATLSSGCQDRLQKEMKALLPSTHRVHITATPDRIYSAWIGGSIWASLSSAEEKWLTKQLYDECGSNIVHRFFGNHFDDHFEFV